jgi:hypothetical protein
LGPQLGRGALGRARYRLTCGRFPSLADIADNAEKEQR